MKENNIKSIKNTPLENWIVEKCKLPTRDIKSLEEYQIGKIRDTIDYAKENSKHYLNSLKNIKGHNINSISDISNIPFTSPSHIENNPYEFLCIPQREIKRVVTLKSSGTLGKEKRIFFSEEDLGLTIDFFYHGMDCLTDNTDKILILLPGNSLGSIGDLLKKAMDLSGRECFIGDRQESVKEIAKFIINNNITCIVGSPIQVRFLAKIMEKEFSNNICKVLLSTDYVPNVFIKELTSKYGCKVFTHYGMTEMGYGGGVECEALQGYHMREADLYFEIINPETGNVLPSGKWGEVVVTTLTRKAMPLIRYRTGDMAAFSSENCGCNTFLKTMKRTLGRIENRILLCGEYFYMWELDEIIFKFESIIDYKANIKNESLVIELTEISSSSTEMKNEIKYLLENYMVERFGRSLKLDINIYTEENLKINSNTMFKRVFNLKI